jgi:hypothetical protein
MIPSLTGDAPKLAAMKADILANPTLAQAASVGDDPLIRDHYNATASPEFWAYRTDVPVREVGDEIDATEIAGLTAIKLQRLQALTGELSGGFINAAKPDRRAGLDEVFSGAGGNITRARLVVLWRRRATVAERLFATGTGSTGSPATMTAEKSVSLAEVSAARTS